MLGNDNNYRNEVDGEGTAEQITKSVIKENKLQKQRISSTIWDRKRLRRFKPTNITQKGKKKNTTKATEIQKKKKNINKNQRPKISNIICKGGGDVVAREIHRQTSESQEEIFDFFWNSHIL